MTKRFTRDRIIELLRELPAEATLDDAIENSYSSRRSNAASRSSMQAQGVPHDEVKSRLDELVATGVIRPPQEPGDPFEDWPDIRLPRGTANELIDRDREEK